MDWTAASEAVIRVYRETALASYGFAGMCAIGAFALLWRFLGKPPWAKKD